MDKQRSIARILAHSTQILGDVIPQALQLKRLQRRLQYVLQNADECRCLAEHVRLARFDGRCLVLAVADPTVAAHFRYHLPLLLETLRQNTPFQRLESIHHLTLLAEEAEALESLAPCLPLALSTEICEQFQHTAQRIQNSALKQTLQDIAAKQAKQRTR